MRTVFLDLETAGLAPRIVAVHDALVVIYNAYNRL
jgi:hypothetical protein